MRAVALDIGETRVGVAVSDASGRVAFPVKVLPAAEVLGGARSWRKLLEDFEPDVVVCGKPYTLAGVVGAQASRLEEQARHVADACGLPLEFVDERFSSVEAKRILRKQGKNEKEMRGIVDMIAASLFLQTWLDARQSHKEYSND